MMSQYKLVVYIPETHTETVKAAMFNAGAGRQGNYDQCCWQVKGQGQFRPLPGSQAFIGEQGRLETLSEYRVEMLCDEHCLSDVVDALKLSHPYDEPAFDVIELKTIT